MGLSSFLAVDGSVFTYGRTLKFTPFVPLSNLTGVKNDISLFGSSGSLSSDGLVLAVGGHFDNLLCRAVQLNNHANKDGPCCFRLMDCHSPSVAMWVTLKNLISGALHIFV